MGKVTQIELSEETLSKVEEWEVEADKKSSVKNLPSDYRLFSRYPANRYTPQEAAEQFKKEYSLNHMRRIRVKGRFRIGETEDIYIEKVS